MVIHPYWMKSLARPLLVRRMIVASRGNVVYSVCEGL